jgi:hypothetical protein
MFPRGKRSAIAAAVRVSSNEVVESNEDAARVCRNEEALQRNCALWGFCVASVVCVHRLCFSVTSRAAISYKSVSALVPDPGGV